MARETEPEEFVSIQELVEICGLSDSTLYKLAKQNKLPGAGWEASGVLERNSSSGNLQPRYRWTVHLETFMAWWTQHLEKNRQENHDPSRLKPSDFSQKVETESPAPTTERKPRPRIDPEVKKYITLLRKDGYTAIEIQKGLRTHQATSGWQGRIPSLSGIRNIAQAWDDENGQPHLEIKRNRPTNAQLAARANLPETQEVETPEPPVDDFTSSGFIQEVQIYEHNIGDQVRMSNATHFICSECKKGRRNPERLSLSVVRPGRSEQKDVATHLLCSAVCAIKFIEEKEETEWNNTTLQRLEPRQQEITFPLPNTAPPEKSQTGSLWRRFRDLVGGNE